MNDNFLPAKGIVVWARITGSGTWPALVLRRTVYSSSHAWRVRVFGIHPKLPENEVDLSTSSLECFVSQLHRYKHHSNSEAIRAACQFLSSDASNCFQRAAYCFATSRSRKSRNSITAKRPRGLVQSSSVSNGSTANRILPLRPAPPTLPPNSAVSHNSASVVSTSSLSVQSVKQPSSATNNSLSRIASKVSKPLNKPTSETCVPVPHQYVPSVRPSSNHGDSGGSIPTIKPANRAPEQNKKELPRKVSRAVNLAPRPPPPPPPAISKNNSDGSQMTNTNNVGAVRGQFNPVIRPPPPPPPTENKGTNMILAKTPGQPPQLFQSFAPSVPSSSIIGASFDEKIGTARRDTANTRLQPCQPSQNSKPVTPSSCETIAEEKNQVKRKPAKIMPKPVRHPQNSTPVDPSSSTVGTTARDKTATGRKPAKIRPKPTQQIQNPTPVVPSSSIAATAPVEETAPSRKCGKIALKPAEYAQNSNPAVPSSSIAGTSRVEKSAATNLKRAKTLLPRSQPSSDMRLSVPASPPAETSVVEKVTATGVKLAQTTQNSVPLVPTSSSMTTSRAEKAVAAGVQLAQPTQNSTPAAPSAPPVGAPVVENAAASIANQSNANTNIVQHSTQPIVSCMPVVTKSTLVETSAGEKSIAIGKHADSSAQPSQSTDNSIPTNDGTSAMDKSIAESQDPSKTSIEPNEDGAEKRTVNRVESVGISIEPKRRNSEKKVKSVTLLEKEGPRTREELERIARWMRMRIMTNGLDEEVVALARGGNVPLPIPAYESNRSEVLTIRKKYVPRAKRKAKNAKKRGESVRLKKTVVPVGVEKIVTAAPITERSDAEKKRMIM